MGFRWYTRARKFPQLIGRTPDGTRIPGGPYTYTQVGVGAVVGVVLSQTMWLWAHAGMVGNTVFAIGATAGAVFLSGKLPPGMRNPLVLGSGISRLVSGGFKVNGKKVEPPPRPRPTSGCVVVFTEAPQPTKKEGRVRRPITSDAPQDVVGEDRNTIAIPAVRATTTEQKPCLTAVQRLLLGETP